MHIILAMRRFLTALALSVSILRLSAEKAVWYMPVEPGFTTDAGTFFLPDAFEGLSDEIPTGSSVALKNEENGKSTVITITGNLPELPEGYDIAITEAASEELGIGTEGKADVSVSVLSEGTIGDDNGNTGWYTFRLGSFDSGKEAYEAYRRLEDNGLKPYIEEKDGALELSIQHIVAFRMAEVENLIRISGFSNPEAVMEANPYT